MESTKNNRVKYNKNNEENIFKLIKIRKTRWKSVKRVFKKANLSHGIHISKQISVCSFQTIKVGITSALLYRCTGS